MTEWRAYPLYPAYLVSDDGRIRRVLRDKRQRCGNLGRILKPSCSAGYEHVILIGDGERKSVSIHRLVALTFIGFPPTPEHQVAHWDGDRRNNRATNLRWATARENGSDRLRHGTWHVRTWNSKLTEADIYHIQELAKSGTKQSKIAKDFGVQPAHISKVVRGLKWRSLTNLGAR